MARKKSLYFDEKDHELLAVVNSFLERDTHVPLEDNHNFFHTALHPRGVKELAMSQEIRVAYAVINLLDTLEAGQMQDRIEALRSLHDEVLYSATSSFRYNTGRVLIQIMKGLVRAHGNVGEQLRLAHDFRTAASGRRRIIRKMLRSYYLLEMPEEWNQISFDNHVHDANTKGRKSPTHLIMDAWIKGIRKLDVVYYNFVEPNAVSELLQAAEIMELQVRVGVEFQALFRGRYVQFIWQPSGFADWRDMLAFLEEKPTRHLMRMGREASLYHHEYVMRLLARYNSALRFELSKELGLELSEISEQEILSFVGIGQTSRTHLAELIYRRIRMAFAPHLEDFRARKSDLSAEEKNRFQELVERINGLIPEAIIAEWLGSAKSPDVILPHRPKEDHQVPEIMRLLPATLIDWLSSIRTPCHITLNLSRLSVGDVLELLYECGGMISHLELFNLKNYEAGKMSAIEEISELQTAINEGSTVALKRLIRNIIRQSGCSDDPHAGERCELFREILRNIPKLQNFYMVTPLKARIGSDSTSRSSQLHGMGFAFLETLPSRALKALREPHSMRELIPLTQEVYEQVTYYPRRNPSLGHTLTGLLKKIPGLSKVGMHKKEAWLVQEKSIRYCKNGNITSLGGFQREPRVDLMLDEPDKPLVPPPDLAHMNTTIKNSAKVILGFALTVATFSYTQSWWFLAWFGPIIWFAITGFRNILQATLGGGGLRRTPLLGWNAYLSWSRLSDSLMFTGISVPLLELGVRSFLLDQLLGINALNSPTLFYSIMSMVNGIYISTHNIFRGLPREAVIGNIFRSILAIPVSILYNFATLEMFIILNWPMLYLEQGAAVLSKLASDSVAAIIEGFADKTEYLRIRRWDYSAKLSQLFTCFSSLEILLPEEDVVDLLRRPKEFIRAVRQEAPELEKTIVVNSLDLMYLWMYQPRARSTLARLLATMTQEERIILAHAQLVLTQVHEVSQMLVDGLAGPKFARPLAFYLARQEEYLADMAKLTGVNILPQEE